MFEKLRQLFSPSAGRVSQYLTGHRSIGAMGEELACTYLKKLGYKIVAQNVTFRGGEIDIVAIKKGTTHFIEVKYKRGDAFGSPADAMTPTKIKHLLHCVKLYCMLNKVSDEHISLDFLGISDDGRSSAKMEFIEQFLG